MVELKGGNEQEGEGGEHCRIKAMDPEQERERESSYEPMVQKGLPFTVTSDNLFFSTFIKNVL